MLERILTKEELVEELLEWRIEKTAYKVRFNKRHVESETEIGNTVSNFIPITLADARSQGIIPNNLKIHNSQFKTFNILLSGFSVGYSWGATLIKIGL